MLRLFLSSSFMVAIGMGFSFFSQIALLKILPVEQYGIYSFVFSLSLVVAIFALFGFQNSAVRIISNYITGAKETENLEISAFVSFSHKFTLGLSCVSAIIIFGVLSLTPLADKYSLSALWMGALIIPVTVFVRLNAGLLRGFHKSALSVLFETTLREGLFVVFIFASIFMGWKLELGIEGLILFTAALVISGLISWVALRYFLPKNKIKSSVNNKNYKDWITTSFPMMLVIFAQRLMRRSDIIIIGIMMSPVLVGMYALAAQFSEVGSISQKVVQSVFSSRAAALYTQGEYKELRKLYWQNLVFSVVTTAFICTMIMLVMPYVLAFLDKGLEGAYNALLILLIGQFLMVCTGPSAALLAMTKYEKTVMWITFVAAFGNIILNIPFILWFGLEGAAAVTAFFMVFRNVVSYIFVVHYRILKAPIL